MRSRGDSDAPSPALVPLRFGRRLVSPVVVTVAQAETRQATAERLARLSDEELVGSVVGAIVAAYPTLVPNDLHAGMLGVVAPDALTPNDKQNGVQERVAELTAWRAELARRLSALAMPVEGEAAMPSPAAQPLPPTEAQ